ncbi:AAA family ATPase [Sedimenticola selenatireducens]|uniref:AAA family ATPase n=1 Tax=Sedimenticola selenatireducens TaxID=191960 RepID=A0A557SNQ3_9GAMM|nr:AAA family ATPase [Sedimenticola selenatireducens]TVO78990.1 AAA family ATPase [Sedimenticola selenatireducens]TVT67218.1 MAG: AAA family ATPase [Sedimenticola selenatireducens]
MYDSFYHFKAEPFRLSPDHRFCFSHKSYAKAKAYMQYAIHRAEGFVMVTGKPGTGKTTLVNDLVEGLSSSKIVVATIVSTQLEADDLLLLVSCNFGLDIDAPNKAVVLQGLSVRLRRFHEEGTRALLIIDEAQDLSASALEELRLLTNLQLNNQPLLQIFLVGQENLRDLVQKPSMEQVHQRLVAACHLESLNEEDTKAYIKHRLDRVGWKDDPTIDEGVYDVVYQFSQGIPRRINLVCSRFLLHGSVEEKHRIRAADVRTVVQELQHEQLTPIGFKAELPPLFEEEDMEETAVVEAGVVEESIQPKQPETHNTPLSSNPEEVMEAAQALKIEDVAQSPMNDAPVASLESKIDQAINRQVNSERDSADKRAKSKTEDAIQENYFSLGGGLEAPSEPIPIRPTQATKKSEYGYGDRFANAQRKKEQANTATHYYNEYQVNRRTAVAAQKKRGVFSTLLLLILFLGVLISAVYVVRPQVLSSEITYIEDKLGHYIQRVRDRLSGSSIDSPVMDSGVIKKEESLNATPHVDDKEDTLVSNVSIQETPGITSQAALTEKKVHDDQAATTVKATSELSQNDVHTTAPRVIADNFQLPTAGTITPDAKPIAKKIINLSGQKIEDTLPIPMATEEKALSNQPVINEVINEKDLTTQSNVSVNAENRIAAVSMTHPAPDTDVKVVAKEDESSLLRKLSEQQVKKKDRLNVEKPITQVFFKSDSTSVDQAYYDVLNNVVGFLKQNDNEKAYITGYADSSGDTNYNRMLSEMRANAVAAYLETNSIQRQRLVVVGRGVHPAPDVSSGNKNDAKKMQRLVEIVFNPSN